jgi:hypothetical protein
VFIVRKEQMDALRRADLARYVRRAITHLRAARTGALTALGGVDDAAAEAFVRDGIKRAEAHGFTEETDVLHYLELMALLGPGFGDDPALEGMMGLLYEPEDSIDWPDVREMFVAAKGGG